MHYYVRESGDALADAFYDEFMAAVCNAGVNPEGHSFDSSGLRRTNLRRFPYHFLYRVRQHDILILVLRHHRRHPSFGLGRK